MKPDRKPDRGKRQWNQNEIERHLQSAVSALTPDVFASLDLSACQEREGQPELQYDYMQHRILVLKRRLRRMTAGAAACLIVAAAGAGGWYYHVENGQVDSVIGFDVNPSIELSINRKSRVLSAAALNEDAEGILDGMELKGVDLHVAVNALIGSMVTHGYLDQLENAILVTVSNDSVSKSAQLRTSVVGDVEQSLQEYKVQAVVYDQQAVAEDQVEQLAAEYGISYGKAYFLKELISQNANLSMDDMKELSSMTMEEIAQRISENSLALGERTEREEETAAASGGEEAGTEEPAAPEEPSSTEETEAQTEAETKGEAETGGAAAQTPELASDSQAKQQNTVEDGLVDVDFVDWEDGQIYVYFVTFVKWKNPTVSIRDEAGNRYPAYVEETERDLCVISAEGLEGGKAYTFVLGGLTPREGGGPTTVTGYFEVPEIADSATEASLEEDESSAEDSPSQEGKAPAEDSPSQEGKAPAEDSSSQEGEELAGEGQPQEGEDPAVDSLQQKDESPADSPRQEGGSPAGDSPRQEGGSLAGGNSSKEGENPAEEQAQRNEKEKGGRPEPGERPWRAGNAS